MKTSFNSQFKKKSNNKGIFSPFASGFTQSVDFGITSRVFSINSIKKHIAQYLNVSLLHLRRRKNPMPKLTSGFTLVETMLAILIFSLSVTALFALIGNSLYGAQYAKNDIVAQYLSLEALDSIRNDRDTIVFQQNTNGNSSISADWSGFLGKYGSGGNLCFGTNGCAIDAINNTISQCFPTCPSLKLYASGFLSYYGITGAGSYKDTQFTRVVKMYQNNSNADSVLVTSTVTWNTGRTSNSKTYSEMLYNWGQ